MEALATYHFLTASQMVRLGISASIKSLQGTSLTKLTNGTPRLVEALKHKLPPPQGALPWIYYLTDRGARELRESRLGEPLSRIRYPKSSKVYFAKDYYHRVACIDFHIALRQWADSADMPIEFYDYDFDRVKYSGNTSRTFAKNYIKLNRGSFIADAAFRFLHDGKTRLCLLEFHNKANPKAVATQLDQHIDAFKQGVVREKYKQPKNHFVLSVHKEQSILDTTIGYLMGMKDFRENFMPGFHFNTLDRVKESFTNGWIMANGERSFLFEHVEGLTVWSRMIPYQRGATLSS